VLDFTRIWNSNHHPTYMSLQRYHSTYLTTEGFTRAQIKNHTTRIDVEWDIKISGFYGIFTRGVGNVIQPSNPGGPAPITFNVQGMGGDANPSTTISPSITWFPTTGGN
jgi:hypothetical protein